MHKYDLAVFIGRFQPFHMGHYEVIKEALKHAEMVLVLVGSSFTPRSYRNPFTYDERSDMIKNAFSLSEQTRILTYPIVDSIYNDVVWIESIQTIVDSVHVVNYNHTEKKICLVGHEKDHSSFYLKLFPQWDNIAVENVENISSTDIRKNYFNVREVTWSKYRFKLPENVDDFLVKFSATSDYDNLVDEYKFVQDYKKSWDDAPYEPIFVTTDAVVIQSGHILLIERKARPGKGLWALPGGFLNPNEKILDGVLRELKEETKIKVPLPVLKGNIVAQKVFDDPFRSSRGRTITHGFLIHLPPEAKLPLVKGSDDAKTAKWFPLAEVTRSMMFEDHFDIIENLTNLL